MKPVKPILLFILFAISLATVNAQSKTFITQLSELQNSYFSELKGRFVSESANEETYYQCKKSLEGFTTFILQANGKGRMKLVAAPNDGGTLPPELEPLLAQLTKMASMLNNIKKDSDTDPELKAKVQASPKLKRIIGFVKSDKSESMIFYVNTDNSYAIYFTQQKNAL
jgi:hypothetical protein